MKTCVFLLLQVFGGQDGQSDQGKPEATVRVWHNFSTDALDRDEIASWTLVAPEFLHFAADRLILGDSEKQTAGGRGIRLLGAILPLLAIEAPMMGASHEYGHFRADSIFGMKNFEFIDENDDSDRFSADPFNAILAVVGNWTGHRVSAGVSDSDWENFFSYSQNPPPHFDEYLVMVDAGGLNQSQYNSEVISERVLNGDAHVLESVTYFANLFGTVLYPTEIKSSDVTGYVDDLYLLGSKTDVDTVQYWSQLPKLFGNTSLSLLRSLVNFIETGDKKVEPLRLQLGDFRLYWPEFASYLTLHGPTVKIAERLDWRSQAFTISLEGSLSKDMWEAGIAWKGKITNFLSGEARALCNLESGGTWVEAGPVVRLFSWLSVGCKAYYGNGYTFNRDVSGQVPSFLKEEEYGVKGFLELDLKF